MCVYVAIQKSNRKKKYGSHKYNLKKKKLKYVHASFCPFSGILTNSQQEFTRTTQKLMCIQQKWKAGLSFKEFVNYLGKCNI